MRYSFSFTSKVLLANACGLALPYQTAWARQSAASGYVAEAAAAPEPAASAAPKPVEPAVAQVKKQAASQPPTVDETQPAPAFAPKAAVQPTRVQTPPAQTEASQTPPAQTSPVPTPSSPATELVAPNTPEKLAPGGATAAPTMHVVPPTPPPLPPEAPLAAYFDVGVVLQTNWNTDSAYDFFSDDDTLPQGGLVIGADVVSVGALVFGIDLNALFSDTSNAGPLSSYISNSELSETDLGAGLTLRYSLLSWLAPQVRVGGGVALQQARLTGVDFGELREDFTTGYLTLGGGLAFTPPAARLSRTRTWLNSLGLRVIVEAGYRRGQELEFSVKAKPANDSDAPNPIAATSLGVLPQSGPYLRVSAHARF